MISAAPPHTDAVCPSHNQSWAGPGQAASRSGRTIYRPFGPEISLSSRSGARPGRPRLALLGAYPVRIFVCSVPTTWHRLFMFFFQNFLVPIGPFWNLYIRRLSQVSIYQHDVARNVYKLSFRVGRPGSSIPSCRTELMFSMWVFGIGFATVAS